MPKPIPPEKQLEWKEKIDQQQRVVFQLKNGAFKIRSALTFVSGK